MENDPAQATIPLEVRRLAKSYPERGGMLFRRRLRVTALAEVSLTLAAQQTLGIVGASGAGKSTLARCLACLEAPEFFQAVGQFYRHFEQVDDDQVVALLAHHGKRAAHA